jgi:hypothetical protein
MKNRKPRKDFIADGLTSYNCGYLHDTYRSIRNVPTEYNREESDIRRELKEKFNAKQRV